jgi:hypothetical protein
MTIVKEGTLEGIKEGVVEASLLDTDTLPELVPAPVPDEIETEPPRDSVPSPSPVVTAPPLASPSKSRVKLPSLPELSPESRVKLPMPLVEDDPELSEDDPPESPESPAVRLNVPPLSLLEPVEIPEELSPDPVDGFPPMDTPPSGTSCEVEGLGVASRF